MLNQFSRTELLFGKEAMEKLARLEDAEEKDRLGQWIPINERLPEPYKEGEDE